MGVLGGALRISWQQIHRFLLMATSSSWFKKNKQAWLPPQWLYTCQTAVCQGERFPDALGPDGLSWGCKVVGLAQCVWFFFLFIRLNLNDFRRGVLFWLLSHYLLFDSHVYLTCPAPEALTLPPQTNRRRKQTLRLSLFRSSRENTEENRCFFTILG